MGLYKTTAKGAEPFAKRTAAPVTIAGNDVVVYFNRPEKGAGWDAFAGNGEGAESARGANLDAAVTALKAKLEAPVAEPAVSEEIPAREESAPEETTEEIPAPVAKMVAGEVSALVMKAYRESAAAMNAYMGGKATREDSESVTCRSFTTVFETVATGRASGIDSGTLDRLMNYAGALITHHNHRVGGGLGSPLTRTQNARARAKLAKVALSMV